MPSADPSPRLSEKVAPGGGVPSAWGAGTSVELTAWPHPKLVGRVSE